MPLETLIATVHIVACVVLVVLVLLQSGKEGMGVIFGGGSGSVFGSAGAGGLLVKLTAAFGALFLVSSLAYNYYTGLSRKPAASIMQGSAIEQKAVPAENKKTGMDLFEKKNSPDAQNASDAQKPAGGQKQ
jgi:preprotein translocase subunit SecG